MEQLSMCRICLVEDIRLVPIVGTHLQEMYESLVLMPLESKDGRPVLVCYMCCARLKNCYELKKSCLQSEELFTQMLSCNEYWAEKKFSFKKHIAKAAAEMKRTGGGAADNSPRLSPLDRRLVAVMGGMDFAAGDQNSGVNPFPQMASVAQETRSLRPVESSVVSKPPVSEDIDMQHSSMKSITEDPGPSRIPRTASTLPASSTQLPTNIPRPRRRVVRSVDSDMERFAKIEARRVEAEMTAAQALSKIAEALLSVSDALRGIAKKMPDP